MPIGNTIASVSEYITFSHGEPTTSTRPSVTAATAAMTGARRRSTTWTRTIDPVSAMQFTTTVTQRNCSAPASPTARSTPNSPANAATRK